MCPLTFLVNIIGGKGAISNINYYHHYFPGSLIYLSTDGVCYRL